MSRDKFGNEVLGHKGRQLMRILETVGGGGVHEDLIASVLWGSRRPHTWPKMISWYVFAMTRISGQGVRKVEIGGGHGRIWQLYPPLDREMLPRWTDDRRMICPK